ncbi:MAG TPA: gamma-glutamyl-gamma-aminobutyrate hydrolase family protein [Bryobacteraceae bacterium]|nr:gamma-glutamyl-gamma-aminobutyrate hydrolase family protein [Bryobacteraceae bacterium]
MKAGVTFRKESKVVRYEFALRTVGIEPVRIAPDSGPDLDSLDGLVLTGGTDINPARYGQPRNPETEDPDDARDELELRALEAALARGLPILAICRGMQLFNVAHGGTLIQHLPSANLHSQNMPDAEPGRHGATHAVQVARDTRLAAIVGEGELAVNSRHHQAVDRPGEGLVVSAVSTDGIIEALERPDLPFALAVQWHPEDRILVSEADRKLFEAFAQVISRHRPHVLQHR